MLATTTLCYIWDDVMQIDAEEIVTRRGGCFMHQPF